jgi:predicted permease
MLVNNPSFTLIAVLTLAVGISVNTAIFTVFNAVVLRPLDVPEPERVVQVDRSVLDYRFSYPDYIYLRDNARLFSGFTAATLSDFSMSGVPAFASGTQGGLADAVGFSVPEPLSAKNAEPVVGMLVAENYFQVLDVSPIMGRAFIRNQDDKPGAQPVLLLSENFWERRFARDPGVLGRALIINDLAFTVIGITPHDFTGTAPIVPSIWVPLTQRDRLEPGTGVLRDRGMVCCRLYGRLGAGVVRQQAQVEADALLQRLNNLYPDTNAHGKTSSDHLVLTRASAFEDPGEFRTSGVLIQAAASSVLLIACANVASLLLARSAARQKEIAVRLAIGASRGRLVRQLVTESALTGALAGATGLMLAWWVLHLFMLKIADSIPNLWVAIALHLAPDHRVFAYTLLISTMAVIACGLVPALQASNPNLTLTLKEQCGAFGGPRRSELRDVLVGGQVAVSLVLLIGAGLLARGSQRAFGINLGFDYRSLIGIEFRTPAGNQDLVKARVIRRQMISRIEIVPGVKSVTLASRAPLNGRRRSVSVAPSGGSVDLQHALESIYTLVSSNYFDTLGVAIVRGRNFSEHDGREGDDFSGAPVIVSERTAPSFWPGQDPIGKQISFEAPAESFAFPAERHPHSSASVVIGVAKNVRSVRPVLIGIGVGLVAAAAAGRVLVSLLFGLSTFDPATFLCVSVILAAVALLAGYIPARRAMKVDPMVALRYE